MRKALKWIGIVLLVPVLLFFILAALLYVPPVQNWLVQRVVASVSESTGMDITVERISLSFPLDLEARGVRIIQLGDTIADIRQVVADVQLWPLLRNEVVVDALELHDAKINTLDFIGDLRLQGSIGQLHMKVPVMRLDDMEIALERPLVSNSDLKVFMSDTAAIDTSTTGWRIRFDRFDLRQTHIAVIMDSAAVFADSPTSINAYMGQARLSHADLDLGLGRFAFGGIDWQDGALSYDDLFSMSHVSLGLDSLFSYAGELRIGISHASLYEDSLGLKVESLKGVVSMDGEKIRVKDLVAHTPHSYVAADADIDFATFALSDSITSRDYDNQLKLDVAVGKEDFCLISPDLPPHLLPDLPLTLRADINGSASQMNVERFNMTLPTIFQAEANGILGNVANVDNLLAQLNFKAETFNLDPFVRYLGLLPPDYRIPKGIKLDGKVNSRGRQQYAIDMKASEGGGSILLHGTVDLLSDSYDLQSEIRELDLRHFMPLDSLGVLSADINLKSKGVDPFNPACVMDASIQLHHLEYGTMTLDSLLATASINDGRALVHVESDQQPVVGLIDIDATIAQNKVKATLQTQLSQVDLQTLGFSQDPTVISVSGNIEVDSDMKLSHHLSAQLSDIYIRDTTKVHRPEDINILVNTNSDTTIVHLKSGDLTMMLDASGNYEELATCLMTFADSLVSLRQSNSIDQDMLKQLLPTARLTVSSQRNNPVADILRASTGIDFKDLTARITMSPTSGINGDARLLALNISDTPIDTIRFTLVDKGQGQTFNGQITNNHRNPMATFNILFDGLIQQHGASFGMRYFDEQGRCNIRVGAKAEMMAEGLRFQLIPARPTLGYKEFSLNDDNYLLVRDNFKLEANVDMQADDGTRIKVYSENNDSTLSQDLTISASHLDLGELTEGVAMFPNIIGMLNGDYHVIKDQEGNISVASDMEISGLAYEGSPIGNLGAEFVYLLREDDTHVIDGMLMLDDDPIGTLQGNYHNGKRLDATLTLESLPLSIVNGFMPDQLIGFEGTADGTLSVKGPMSDLRADGELRFSDGYLVSNPYGTRMRFGNTPVKIVQSRLLFEDFSLYSYNDNPLNITGNVDFKAVGDSAVNLRLRANNFQLINAKQKKESVAYGRMFVNFFARLSGDINRLNMRGRLEVLGSTDLNYILLDSPLSTDNQMDELVRFTDFNDTTRTTVVSRPESDALTLDMQLNIDQGAHVRCALNTDQSNYVDLLGGGNLRMRMNDDGIGLTGRYTISSGTMKYSLPIIPLKTFTLHEGSYVEFTGQPDNPTLNITATERTRAAVATEDGQSRNVYFDCGVVITQTLSDMGLLFTIASPEDLQLQNELSSMSVEQRGKLAVTMLTTGMYLADGNYGAFSMNSALSSFLQSEINNITSNALKTVDLQLGLDNTTDASGQMHTDYSFKFAKRFWNNRLNVQIGGKVSTGSEVQGQNQSFFDNVTMEYRLSPTSNQYVKLFYKQNVYDWLEGYTGEYGGGYVWKRKLDHLRDIFRFTPAPASLPARSVPSMPAITPSQSNPISNDTIQKPQ